MKYQFCISFENTTVNSAATKAVADCSFILSDEGYENRNITVWDNTNKLRYYLLLVKQLIKLLISIKSESIIAIQYPLLSVNNIFKYYINLAKIKKNKVFCIVHDLESLRTGGKDERLIKKEIDNLNYFDCVIVHNQNMLSWLKDNGMRSSAVVLELFDYLHTNTFDTQNAALTNTIVYAGNLNKSTFVYKLPTKSNWRYHIYGPNFNASLINNSPVKWCGEFSPETVAEKLDGNFGLIWDGNSVDCCDEILGNYLKYNNPHKFSLYIAAGLPVIAPVTSAIAQLINRYKIGILINSLHDLEEVEISGDEFLIMKKNVLELRKKVNEGFFFKKAIQSAERIITNDV